MKKALLVIVSMLVVTMVFVGCSSGQGGSQASSATQANATGNVRTPEALPTAQGVHIVSDLEHVYFYYDHPGESIKYGEDGVYCADANLESATLIFQSYRSDPLCLLGDKLYCTSSLNIEGVDLKSHDIVAAANYRSGARSLAPCVINGAEASANGAASTSSGAASSASAGAGTNADSSASASAASDASSSASSPASSTASSSASSTVSPTASPIEGSSAALLCATYDDGLVLGTPSADGTLAAKQLEGIGDDVLYALTGDGVVYFSCLDDGYQVCSYDMEKGTVTKIAQMETEDSFTVVGSDVYFRVEMEGGSDDSDKPKEFEIMRADAAGNVSSTGVSGNIGGLLYSYGDFVFYTTYIEKSAASNGADGAKSSASASASGKSGASASAKSSGSGESEEPLWLGRPSYYDTVNGGKAVIDRDAYDGMDIALRGVSGGYLYFDGHVVDELTGRESFNVYLDKIDGSGDMVNVDLFTKDAKPTDQVLAWNEAEAQRQQEESEKSRQEYEERIKNEPYGPGTSKLYLKAEEGRSACYRLVRRDGSVEFQILLAPGEKTTQSFPCGRYTLKIAQGKEWISDEEAFGPSGEYDTTDLFNFEAGKSYEIGAGTGSSIRNDSQSGFTG